VDISERTVSEDEEEEKRRRSNIANGTKLNPAEHIKELRE